VIAIVMSHQRHLLEDCDLARRPMIERMISQIEADLHTFSGKTLAPPAAIIRVSCCCVSYPT
jgi:hypothetical protein